MYLPGGYTIVETLVKFDTVGRSYTYQLVTCALPVARVGCREAQGCGWFFVDESPNRSRLWCSSEVCGNRERARRAYAKRRASRA